MCLSSVALTTAKTSSSIPLAAVHLHPLQSVLNAAAKLIIQKRKYDYITLVIWNDLHLAATANRIQALQGMSVHMQVSTSKCTVVSSKDVHPSMES